MNKTVIFKDGTVIPALGQGTWFLGEHSATYRSEKEA